MFLVDVKKEKKRRYFFGFRFERYNFEIILLDIGASSSAHANKLAILAMEALNAKNYRNKNYWSTVRPDNAPKEGFFVMHEGKILSFKERREKDG